MHSLTTDQSEVWKKELSEQVSKPIKWHLCGNSGSIKKSFLSTKNASVNVIIGLNKFHFYEFFFSSFKNFTNYGIK